MEGFPASVGLDDWTEQDKERLIREIEKAHREWLIAQEMLNQVDTPDLIDYSIYFFKAAEAKYIYLHKLGKAVGLKLSDHAQWEEN